MLALAGAAVLLPAAAGAGAALVHRRGLLFGSPVHVQAVAGAGIEAAVDAVWRGLAGIHRRWNAWKPGELVELNRDLRAGRTAVVSPALRRVLEQARALERLSMGTFNPAIGGLVGAWGFHADALSAGPAPAAATLARWQHRGPRMADLWLDGDRVASRHPLVQIDLGAYAKGVAVDLALDRLQRAGAVGAVVDLGGNLATLGHAQGRPWRIGLRDPATPDGLIATVTTSAREAVVTSGIYERWRAVPGEPVASHILDPRSAAPAAELVSVTVLHPSAALADAAATALLVAGPSRWREVAQRMHVHDVLVVDRHERALASRTLAPRLVEVTPYWRSRIGLV